MRNQGLLLLIIICLLSKLKPINANAQSSAKQHMKAYFEEIVSLYQEISNGSFNIQLNIDDISIQSERMVYFGLIFNEMISNTIEHSNSADKTIYFSSTKSENGFRLVYQDNSSFENVKNGTGLELIEQLIHRIEGNNFKFEGNTGKYQFEFYV